MFDEIAKYIDNIKKNMKVDIYSVINTTIINNFYITNLSKNFFIQNKRKNKIPLFIKSSIKFYFKQIYIFITYLISFFIYKIFYRKKSISFKNSIFIDLFFLVDNIIEDNKFNENYFIGLYDILDKHNQDYIFLPRLYGTNKNPFKLIKLFKIINNDSRKFLFEFEFLSFKDFIELLILILLYPFKTLRLLQKENSNNNIAFNNELIYDIEKQSFNAFSRYIFGKNIAKLNDINKIYSWSEFQVVERSFNYGIRANNKNIKIYGCQLYINYPLLNTYISDRDYIELTSPHKVFVNGKYYLLEREKVKYSLGISLRYSNIFKNDISYFLNKQIDSRNILLLISYFENELSNLIDFTTSLNKNILFKRHPANSKDVSKRLLSLNYKETKKNIYELFPFVDIIISSSTGSTLEAVACGKSVIIISDKNGRVGNPLVKHGKGKIWDIAFNKDDIQKLYNTLLEYREENPQEIKEIASWYRDNFFVEPTEENIIKVFELERNI